MNTALSLFDLSGRIALVTGANRGLGKAIALGLAGAGADVVLCCRSPDVAAGSAAEIERLGRRALVLPIDLDDWDSIDASVERLYATWGRCDILVNNAGIAQDPQPLVETTEALFDRYYRTNTKGPMHLASLLAPRMAEAGGGVIINVATMGALKPGGQMAMYCSSKAALLSLSRAMAEEWAAAGVRVNAIVPGPFLTDMLEGFEKTTPGFLDYSASVTLLQRLARPEEIVGPVLFLASDASSYVTGQMLSVCGGATYH